MGELLFGAVIVLGLMLVTYGLDVLASRLSRFGRLIGIAATLLGFTVVLTSAFPIATSLLSGDPVTPVTLGVFAGGLVLVLVSAPFSHKLIARAFPQHNDSGRFEIGLIVLLWLVILQIVTYYEVDQNFDEIAIGAAGIQAAALLGIAAASVGFLTRRNLSGSLARLGLDRVTPRVIWGGTLIVIPTLIVGTASVVLIDRISPGSTERLADTVDQITGGETGLGYALAIGIFAAVGEETLFRGALQPKYGLFFTSLVFALLHVQYDLLLVVGSLLPVGIILGFERRYLGTVACIITHALYNTLAVVSGG